MIDFNEKKKRLQQWITNFSDPIKAMQEEFKSQAPNFGKTMINIILPYTRARNVQTLRSEGTLNITTKPEDMAKPVTDKVI